MPSTAMALDDHTMNGLWLMPNTVGMESMANTTSVVARTMTTIANGVAYRRPFFTVVKLCPSYSSDTL